MGGRKILAYVVACLLCLVCLSAQTSDNHHTNLLAARPHAHKNVKPEKPKEAVVAGPPSIQLDTIPDQEAKHPVDQGAIAVALAALGGVASLIMLVKSFIAKSKVPKGRYGVDSGQSGPASWALSTVVCFAGIYFLPMLLKPKEAPAPVHLVTFSSKSFGFSLKLPDKGLSIKRSEVPHTQNIATTIEYTQPDGGYRVLYMPLPSIKDMQRYMQEQQNPGGSPPPTGTAAPQVYYDVNVGLTAMAAASSKDNMSKIIGTTDIEYHGYPGKYIQGTKDPGGIVRERIVAANNCVYALVVLGKQEWVDSPQSQEFMDSLEFVK